MLLPILCGIWKPPKAELMRPDFGSSEPTFLFLIYITQLQIVCDSNWRLPNRNNLSKVTELMAGGAKKGGCPQDLWCLQNKKDASKTSFFLKERGDDFSRRCEGKPRGHGSSKRMTVVCQPVAWCQILKWVGWGRRRGLTSVSEESPICGSPQEFVLVGKAMFHLHPDSPKSHPWVSATYGVPGMLAECFPVCWHNPVF